LMLENTLPLLSELESRIQSSIDEYFSTSEAVFVKLTTRSPKDSLTIFDKASEVYKRDRVIDSLGNVHVSSQSPTHENNQDNARWTAFSEQMLRAAAVKNAREATTVLLDSERVAEDLAFALETGEFSKFNISVVVRAWDKRITLASEFRGFVWNNRLNCLGQYYHPLYFPDLLPLQSQISEDCLRFFELVKPHLPVPNALIDFAWLGPGEVVLIEINPLMEGLGSFSASTGLFNWNADQDLIQGRLPFELRLRKSPQSKANLIINSRLEWRRVIYPPFATNATIDT